MNRTKTVLNLGLKEEFKVDFFGTATGYYDLDKNYQLDGNLVSITKNFKGYLFESANNFRGNAGGQYLSSAAVGQQHAVSIIIFTGRKRRTQPICRHGGPPGLPPKTRSSTSIIEPASMALAVFIILLKN
ncbi:MAG: hypothetical protein U5J63_16190 [Fodinibius sp.]|nr:hypothetical protein [Fodinibius sp.]